MTPKILTFPANSEQAMVFISVWLKLVVNKYFAVYQCTHASQIENVAETNFVENFGRAKQILSVQCVRTQRLTEILETFPRVFCFPKSRINENGGESQILSCKNYEQICADQHPRFANSRESLCCNFINSISNNDCDMIGQSPVPTNKGKGMWFERKQPFVGRSVAWRV